jgi:hypothetical protein
MDNTVEITSADIVEFCTKCEFNNIIGDRCPACDLKAEREKCITYVLNKMPKELKQKFLRKG